MSEQAEPQGTMQVAENAFANLLSGKGVEPEPEEVEATESEELEAEQPEEAVDHLTAEVAVVVQVSWNSSLLAQQPFVAP